MTIRNLFSAILFTSALSSVVYAQPSNDACSGAINLTVDAACVNGSSSTATYEAPVNCFTNGDLTIWYKFTTGVAGFYTVIANTDGASDPVLQLWSGTCAALTTMACVDAGVGGASEQITANLAAGTTYYIRVADYAAGTGGFCMEVKFRPPIPNDCITNAIDISSIVNSVQASGGISPFTCKDYQFANAGSFPTHDAVAGDGDATGAGTCHLGTADGSDINDIWFKFTVDATTPASVWLDAYPFEQTNTASYSAAIYSGTPSGGCGTPITGLTYIDCSGGTFTDVVGGALGGARDVAGCTLPRPRLDVSGLPFGTYYYRVWDQFGDTPDGSVNICAESGAPIAPGEDRCPAVSSPNPPTFQFGCGTMPNWNVDTVFAGLSNAGCYGNGNCVPPSADEPQLALAAAGDVQDNCTGGWVSSLGYLNNVINNTVLYSFEVNACATCQANVEITISNVDYGGVRDNVIQAQVMSSACASGTSIMAYSTTSTCFKMRPAGGSSLGNGRYYIMIDGQDGQLIKYDLGIKITYGGGAGPFACAASKKPIGKTTVDKTSACPRENVTINSTGTDFGMSANTQTLCGAVTYTWDFDGATPVSGSGAGPYVVNWNNTGTTSITKTIKMVVFNNGCASDPVFTTVTIKPTPNSLFDVKTPVCRGAVVNQAVTYTGFARANATYNWGTFDGGVATPGGTNQGPHDISWATSGTKTITLTVTQDLCASVATSKTIVVKDAPTSAFTVNPSAMCLGDEAVITYDNTGTSPGTSAGTYDWNFLQAPASSDVEIIDHPDFKTYKLKWKTAGTKTVSLSVNDFGCTGALTSKSNITVNNTPTFTTKATNTTGSCGSSNGKAEVLSITNQVPGVYTYSWNTTPATAGNPLNNVTAGVYTVRVTDPIGCFAESIVTVLDDAAPTASVSGIQPVVCNGVATGGATITAGAGAGTYTITATNSSGTVVGTPSVDAPLVLTGLAAGTYSYSLVSGTCVVPGSFTITEPTKLIPNAGADKLICPGDIADLTGSVTGGTPSYQYSWDAGLTYANSPSKSFSPTTKTSYTLTVKDANGCVVSSSSPATIDLKPKPTGVITSDKNSLCDLESAVITYAGNGTSLDNYIWDFDLGNANPGFGMDPQTVNWTTTGKKKITLRIDKNGCIADLEPVFIDVSGPPVIAVTIDKTKICEYETAIVEVTGAPASATYVWDYGVDHTIISTVIQNKKFVLKWNSAGDKDISVQATVGTSNNCVSNYASTSIKVNPQPVAPLPTRFNFCERSGDHQLELPDVANPVWYTTATGGTALTAAPIVSSNSPLKVSYYASQMNAFLCESNRTEIKVEVIARRNAAFSYVTPVCKNAPNVFPVNNYVQGGTFSSLTSGLVFKDTKKGEIDLTATPSRSGNYTIRYITTGTCPDTATAPIRINPEIPSNFTYGAPLYCLDGTTKASAIVVSPAKAGVFSEPTGGLKFIDAAKGTIDLVNSKPGKYTITNTVTGNCVVQPLATYEVTLRAIPNPDFQLPSSTCINADIVVNALDPKNSNPNAKYIWTHGDDAVTSHKVNAYASSFTIKWATYGTKTMTYAIEDGICKSPIISKDIVIEDRPLGHIVSDPPAPIVLSIGSNSEVKFQASNADGSVITAKTYAWDFGDGTSDNAAITAHDYNTAVGNEASYIVRMTVSNGANCSTTDSLLVAIVNKQGMKAPTVFTPNGDGESETFRPSVVGARVVSFQVFNRWGEMIYSADNNIQGWNGFYKNKSELVPNGVYVFIVKGVSLTDDARELEPEVGIVTVVR